MAKVKGLKNWFEKLFIVGENFSTKTHSDNTKKITFLFIYYGN